VIWSDETSVKLMGNSGRPNVWRKNGEIFAKNSLYPTVQGEGGSIMMWGCFSWSGPGTSILVDGIMDAKEFLRFCNANFSPTWSKISQKEKCYSSMIMLTNIRQ